MHNFYLHCHQFVPALNLQTVYKGGRETSADAGRSERGSGRFNMRATSRNNVTTSPITNTQAHYILVERISMGSSRAWYEAQNPPILVWLNDYFALPTKLNHT
jgi:hypothetical protein